MNYVKLYASLYSQNSIFKHHCQSDRKAAPLQLSFCRIFFESNRPTGRKLSSNV